jgi:hydroxyacyl-ACP dehydratase HTD2-like protein with hotdog domain
MADGVVSHDPTTARTAVPTPTHLFHFSALTFNAHSIHIDPLYARATDGHRDMLVHGPLTLALMLDALGGRVERISYRNHAPLYVNEELRVCVRVPGDGKSCDVWVEGPDGGLAVKGTATMEATWVNF